MTDLPLSVNVSGQPNVRPVWRALHLASPEEIDRDIEWRRATAEGLRKQSKRYSREAAALEQYLRGELQLQVLGDQAYVTPAGVEPLQGPPKPGASELREARVRDDEVARKRQARARKKAVQLDTDEKAAMVAHSQELLRRVLDQPAQDKPSAFEQRP